MNEEKWDSVWLGTALVDEMDVQCVEAVDIDVECVLRELGVECCFLCAPVESVLPMGDETLHVIERNTIVTANICQLVWESREGQLLPEKVNVLFWDCDLIWLGDRGRAGERGEEARNNCFQKEGRKHRQSE